MNGVLLVVVSIWVIVEAIGRLEDPVEILGPGMLLIAVLGLLVNIAAAWVLIRSGGGSLNVRAALRHVLGDLAGYRRHFRDRDQRPLPRWYHGGTD